jgi:hypothetical protein
LSRLLTRPVAWDGAAAGGSTRPLRSAAAIAGDRFARQVVKTAGPVLSVRLPCRSSKIEDYGEIDLGTAATERACDVITLEIVRGALRATRKASFRHDLRAASLPGVRAGALRFGFGLGHMTSWSNAQLNSLAKNR